jgi:NhaP-type Na+/H+ or K+/H+ antiporter
VTRKGEATVSIDPTLWIVLTLLGAFAFGIVVGWVTYRTLRRATVSGLSDIATVIAAIGGAAVTALFDKASGAFGVYCVGLAIGFFAYLRTATQAGAPDWLGPAPGIGGQAAGGGVTGGGPPAPPPAIPGH